MAKTALLPLLADGAFHSGQELADLLGISRTAVWKQLRKLEELGVEVEVSKSRGYRLPGGIELLDPEYILRELAGPARESLPELVVLTTVDSTNAEVMRRLENGGAAGLVCLAERQNAGRGRRGRNWVSPFGGNIYLSLGWEFAGGAAALEGLSLAVGVAATEALETLGVGGCTLKWPNDILYRGAKLGGILIEMVGDAAGSCQAVIGIGLNLRMPDSQGRDIDRRWTDIAGICPQPPGRNALAVSLLDRLFGLLREFENRGFAPWRERWSARDACAGRPAVVIAGPQRTAGTCVGVDDSGALLLEVGDAVRTFRGGEISLRPDA